ncbi:AraC family transcriptional regulator [Paenibacillus sp. P22]|uniref:AraC family transcriptional regulator n=1 Tax=Paenibacillus sp. P22 TaxID=483908 RepID=UPI000435ABFB|nr:AraC family transcriptional regulator [Paenibacillus sp. P22]CDN43176.1 AraC family transcriptional regulator [Paenibacillus sp. P22]
MELKEHPDRLTIDEYMAESSHCLFRQELDTPCHLHWHEFYELTYVRSGNGVNRVNGTDIPIGEGTLFLLTPADFHEIRPLEASTLKIYNLIFKESMISEEIRTLLFNGRMLSPMLMKLEDRRAGELFAILDEENSRSSRTGELIVRNLLGCLLLMLCRDEKDAIRGEASAAPLHPSIQQALFYLQHRFREPLTLSQAAKAASLSPNYFSECFRQQLGVSFQQHLLDLRLEFSRSLLQASSLPVSEICYASGFNTLTHFEKMYKRKYGHPPSRSRRVQVAGA